MSIDSTQRFSSLSLTTMLLLSLLGVGMAPSVSAVGPNQNDLNSGGDLPDNTTVNITNYIFSGTYTGTGELDYGDDNDFLRVSLNANEGLAASLSFPSSTTFSNGTTVTNDFDLYFFDSNQTMMGSSIFGNPESLSTNVTGGVGTMIYINIERYDGSGSWTLNLHRFTVGSTGNGTGGGGLSVGSTPPSPCTGNGTTAPDILEPNDSTATATLSSTLPLSCTGLSIDSTTDTDYFEIVMQSGVTYYVNVSFTHANGDLDVGWDSSTGSWLTSSGGTSNLESMQYSSTTNQTTYVDVYGYSGAVNTYNIDISTDQPGGSQTYQLIQTTSTSATTTDLSMSSLTSGATYSYNVTLAQQGVNGTWVTLATTASTNFTANGTGHNATVSHQGPAMVESQVCVSGFLYDGNGTFLVASNDCYNIEVLELATTSSTTGTISATNLTSGAALTLRWLVFHSDDFTNAMMMNNDIEAALNASIVDEDSINFTASASTQSWSVNWTGITTMDDHVFVALLSPQNSAVNLTTFDGFIGVHDEEFTPQLPGLLITSVTASTTSATNDVAMEGLDLVNGDDYRYRVRLTDNGGATLQSSNLTNFTATAQNMTMSTWSFSTPTTSGNYCAHADLFTNTMVQMIGDTSCFQLLLDDDNDSVANEVDLCSGTPANAAVDADGCALSQKDSDSDGYNDDVDDFVLDATQWSDMDGDGYGDNVTGNMPDAFPTDSTQWSDADGDGYGDNGNGTSPDAFPQDATQWSDVDGDGYGDNPSGNYPDMWPADGTQWEDVDGDGYGDNPTGTNGDAFPNDATQWSDADADGYGDNALGNQPDAFPADGSQWEDSDGDGYGDNANGNNGDKFPSDATQWYDTDDDGFGDNQAGNDPDAFPNDSTQWSDTDGDGYGDNAAGQNPDAFPADATQHIDGDGDGYGDNANGNNPDLCLNTPMGEAVDANGCSSSQLDGDMDGVPNSLDACPNTPAGESVDAVGCSGSQEDADNDGVMDAFDACPSTSLGSTVDAAGCALYQLDSDGDTITDNIDQCPSTPSGNVVNGVGCAATERDTDGDGVNDANDVCDGTSLNEDVDSLGCGPSQRDTDGDLVNDQLDQCPSTDNGETVDMSGCAENQLDEDNDGIPNDEDLCRITPTSEQADQIGCSPSQKDEDNDDISNALDLCPDTTVGQSVDLDGCAERQLDTDEDGVMDHIDICVNTVSGEIVDEEGCALAQRDSDGDGVNDAEDDFKFDANESVDSDGDGVADRYDDFPEDASRSQAVVDEGGNGMMYALVALGVLAIIGGGGFTMMRKQEHATFSPFNDAMSSEDMATEHHMSGEDKALPSLDDATQQGQQWEENGVHWSRDGDGNLSYYDEGAEAWMPYQQ